RASEIDGSPIVEDDVAIGFAELDLLVRTAAGRFRHEHEGEVLVDVRGHGIVCDHAALGKGREQSSFGTNHVAISAKRHMRVQAVQGKKAQPFCNSSPLIFVRDEVEPVAIANLVDAENMRESIDHAIRPFSNFAIGVTAIRSLNCCKAAALCDTALDETSPLYRHSRAALNQSNSPA